MTETRVEMEETELKQEVIHNRKISKKELKHFNVRFESVTGANSKRNLQSGLFRRTKKGNKRANEAILENHLFHSARDESNDLKTEITF